MKKISKMDYMKSNHKKSYIFSQLFNNTYVPPWYGYFTIRASKTNLINSLEKH